MTFDKIKEVMVDTLSVEADKIDLESRLDEDLGIDSLDAVELSMALEEEFDIKIPDDELPDLKKVSDIVKLIDKLKK